MKIEKIKQIAFEKYGKELTDEQAAQYADKYGALDDSELDNVTGGCGGTGSITSANCPECGVAMEFISDCIWVCPSCGHRGR